MSKDHPEPVVVARYSTEFEASLTRNMLQEAGIPSQLVGGMTAGFRAETPGMVDVLVPGQFAEEAKLMIEEQEEGANDMTDAEGEDSYE